MFSTQLENKILKGYQITEDDAYMLIHAPLKALCQSADNIRKHFMGNVFDLCTIINGKSGKCSEDCKFCAQSSFYHTDVQEYPLLKSDDILPHALDMDTAGVKRYSIVTSGKKLSENEIRSIGKSLNSLDKNTKLNLCGSFGLLTPVQFKTLKSYGLKRYHNNLETNRSRFNTVCTTHSYDDKVKCIQDAQNAGLNVCSGGLMGMGETMKDRIALAFELKALKIKSIPINLLNPIIGTPYEHLIPLSTEEMQRIVAIFRFINPDASIRLAGGRGLLKDKGKACFISGANAAITGDMLTTAGITVDNDIKMITALGYSIGCHAK